MTTLTLKTGLPLKRLGTHAYTATLHARARRNRNAYIQTMFWCSPEYAMAAARLPRGV